MREKKEHIIYGGKTSIWIITRNNKLFLPIKRNPCVEMVLKMTIYEQYPFPAIYMLWTRKLLANVIYFMEKTYDIL